MTLHLPFSMPGNHIFIEYFYWNLLPVENSATSWERQQCKRYSHLPPTYDSASFLPGKLFASCIFCAFFLWDLFPNRSRLISPSFETLIQLYHSFCSPGQHAFNMVIFQNSWFPMKQWTCCNSFIFVIVA